MTTFDTREHAYENKFAHDQETEFNITARRNKLLGLWAAEKMQLDNTATENYAAELIGKTTQKNSETAIVQQIYNDFVSREIALSQADIEAEMEKITHIARDQIINGTTT